MSTNSEAELKIAATDARVKDALDHARTTAQELYQALTDSAALRGGSIRADLETLPMKAKAIAESLKVSLGVQSVEVKKSVEEASAYLEASGARIAEALRSSGQAAEISIQQAIIDARTSVEKISEAVAAKRASVCGSNEKK